MKAMAYEALKCIRQNEPDKVGGLLNKFWEKKKKLSSNVSNKKIDKYYDTALKNGALGGKLIGAGGGGFLLIYAKKISQENYIEFEKFDTS